MGIQAPISLKSSSSTPASLPRAATAGQQQPAAGDSRSAAASRGDSRSAAASRQPDQVQEVDNYAFVSCEFMPNIVGDLIWDTNTKMIP
uniref:Uncharacterized protein n=1 Tax=Solanum lycopersicum TaxID=4081 RepID=A0A3Q7F3X2_SOLLC